jgi:hypothetical protein
MPAVDLAARRREQSARAQAEPQPADDSAEDETPREKVEVAVVIFKRANGQWVMNHDLTVADKIAPVRTPTHDDITGAFAIIGQQMMAQQVATMSAQATVQMQMQAAQAMASGQLPPDLQAQLDAELKHGARG